MTILSAINCGLRYEELRVITPGILYDIIALKYSEKHTEDTEEEEAEEM